MTSNPKWRRALIALVAVAILAGLCWWLLSLGKIEDRVRSEEVEMFDISQPPPPPPPPEIVQPTETTEVAETQQTVQPDPLSAVQPPSTNPPAGDLSSLLQDPTAGASSPFSGGPRGQGGTGSGPLIGGTGTGTAASRAYADLIKNAIMRQLRRDDELVEEGFSFSIRVRVNAAARLEIVGVSDVTPPQLEAAINRALRGLSSIERPPPPNGPVPYVATIRLTQSS